MKLDRAPGRTHLLSRDKHTERKLFVLIQHVTLTIHAATGDTLSRIDIEV